MSAIFRAELASLQRMVEDHQRLLKMDTNKRERERTSRAAKDSTDRRAVLDVLEAAELMITSTEIANRSGVTRQAVDKILEQLVKEKLATRRRRPMRRADGQGIRNPYKYRIAE